VILVTLNYIFFRGNERLRERRWMNEYLVNRRLEKFNLYVSSNSLALVSY